MTHVMAAVGEDSARTEGLSETELRFLNLDHMLQAMKRDFEAFGRQLPDSDPPDEASNALGEAQTANLGETKSRRVLMLGLGTRIAHDDELLLADNTDDVDELFDTNRFQWDFKRLSASVHDLRSTSAGFGHNGFDRGRGGGGTGSEDGEHSDDDCLTFTFRDRISPSHSIHADQAPHYESNSRTRPMPETGPADLRAPLPSLCSSQASFMTACSQNSLVSSGGRLSFHPADHSGEADSPGQLSRFTSGSDLSFMTACADDEADEDRLADLEDDRINNTISGQSIDLVERSCEEEVDTARPAALEESCVADACANNNHDLPDTEMRADHKQEQDATESYQLIPADPAQATDDPCQPVTYVVSTQTYKRLLKSQLDPANTAFNRLSCIVERTDTESEMNSDSESPCAVAAVMSKSSVLPRQPSADQEAHSHQAPPEVTQSTNESAQLFHLVSSEQPMSARQVLITSPTLLESRHNNETRDDLLSTDHESLIAVEDLEDMRNSRYVKSQHLSSRNAYTSRTTDGPATPTGRGPLVAKPVKPIRGVNVSLGNGDEFQIYQGPQMAVEDCSRLKGYAEKPFEQPKQHTNVDSTAIELVSAPVRLPKAHGRCERAFIPDNGEDDEDEPAEEEREWRDHSDSDDNAPPVTRRESSRRVHPPVPTIPNSLSRSRSAAPCDSYARRSSHDPTLMHGRRDSSSSRFRVTDIDRALADSHEHLLYGEAKQGPDAKSCNSLLETDIDTGVGRQIAGHSPASAFPDKTRSLHNLAGSATPFRTARVAPADDGEGANGDDWQRARSVQLLNNAQLPPPPPSSLATGTTASGLIARLRQKAQSEHELRIADSLSKLNLPDWLTKADIPEPYVLSNDLVTRPPLQLDQLKERSRESLGRRRDRNFPFSSSRSVDAYARKTSETNSSSLLNSRVAHGTPVKVQTVAEPSWTITTPKGSTIPRFVRPSEVYRMRDANAPKLEPIKSKLKHSMRSSARVEQPTIAARSSQALQQTRPHASTAIGATVADHILCLESSDFIPRTPREPQAPPAIKPRASLRSRQYSQPRGETPDQLGLPPPPNSKIENSHPAVPVKVELMHPPPPPAPPPSQANGQSERVREKPDGQSRPTTLEDMKAADQDSVSMEFDQPVIVGRPNALVKPLKKDGFKERMQTKAQRIALVDLNSFDSDLHSSHNASNNNNDKPKFLSPGQNQFLQKQKNHPRPSETPSLRGGFAESVNGDETGEIRAIDADQISESVTEATDGLNQLAHLGGFTDLIDSCRGRHELLLQEQEGAVAQLLSCFGLHARDATQAMLNRITGAMRRIDLGEDHHRKAFLSLLASSRSLRPLNLSEFALSHLTGCLERKSHDGRLYLKCALPGCSYGSHRSDEPRPWRLCCNCFTIYCSPECRQRDLDAGQHAEQCNFARSRRLCGQLVGIGGNCGLTKSQRGILAMLARSGHAKLGRGAIALSFASAQAAERFLRLSEKLRETGDLISMASTQLSTTTDGDVNYFGMAVPTYLTMNELLQLDDALAAQCRTYNVASNFVLIVFVCAYELRANNEGMLPVHLIKQSAVLHFPSKYEEPKASPPTTPLDHYTKQDREEFLHQVQRELREKGVSLRNHNPVAYETMVRFVETGIPFPAFELDFRDFAGGRDLHCLLRPMMPLHMSVRDVAPANAQITETEL